MVETIALIGVGGPVEIKAEIEDLEARSAPDIEDLEILEDLSAISSVARYKIDN